MFWMVLVVVGVLIWNFVEKFQIARPTTTRTIQNIKLFNVEFTQGLPKA